MNPTRCPWCGSTDTDAEYVDIGVGFQQVTARVCHECDAQEFNNHIDDLTKASKEEKAKGWWKGCVQGQTAQASTAPECPHCATAQAQRKAQELAYRKAAEDFGRVARGFIATRNQQERVTISLRNQLKDLPSKEQVQQLQNELTQVQQELARVKDELAKEKAAGTRPSANGDDRFSLLEID